MKKIKTNMLINMLVPVFWTIVFFYNYCEVWGIDYSDACWLLWIVLPIAIFVYNTFTETQIGKLALLYTISAGLQALGIAINIFFYYNFASSDTETTALGSMIILLTTMLNLVLSLIGIGIKSLIIRFKK